MGTAGIRLPTAGLDVRVAAAETHHHHLLRVLLRQRLLPERFQQMGAVGLNTIIFYVVTGHQEVVAQSTDIVGIHRLTVEMAVRVALVAPEEARHCLLPLVLPLPPLLLDRFPRTGVVGFNIITSNAVIGHQVVAVRSMVTAVIQQHIAVLDVKVVLVIRHRHLVQVRLSQQILLGL